MPPIYMGKLSNLIHGDNNVKHKPSKDFECYSLSEWSFRLFSEPASTIPYLYQNMLRAKSGGSDMVVIARK